MGVAFLHGPFGWLAWIALVPLFEALDRRVRSGARARVLFLDGYLFGLAFYLVGMYWMLLLSPVAIREPLLKYPAWLLGGAYLALFAGAIALWGGWLARRTGAPLALILPFVWVLVESLRGFGELGFPWFQPGYSQHAYVPLIQMASLGSVSLVTLWLVALNGLLWRAWRGGARGRSALGAALLFALPLAWGQRAIDAAPRGEGPVIALVQANIAGEIKWSGQHQEEILDTFMTLSRRAARAAPAPALLIWPETATGSYLTKQSDQADTLSAFTRAFGVPIFSGFADYAFDTAGVRRFHNAAGLFLADGRIGRPYAKRHLVPFGERMPFQWLIPALGQMQLGQAEWMPGERSGLFEGTGEPYACLICFESIFPRLARADVRAGARWLVNITNDEWFGHSAALYQHAAMARFRAVENRVPLARCANTGLTVMIDAYGRIVGSLPVLEAAVLSAALPPAGPRSWFTRVGDWPAGLALAFVTLLTLVAMRAVLTRKTGRN
jgi:apolipoprotein N-acyltransferase